MEEFAAIAKRKKLPAAVRDRIIRERNWTGKEALTLEGYDAVVAEDAAAHAEVEPGPEESGE